MIRMLKPCLVLLLMCTAVVGSRAQVSPTVFINEFHYDNTGTDSGEFVEIAGPAGTNLAAYSIVLYNGADGKTYDTDALGGVIPNQQSGFGTVSLAYPSNGIQNGSPDAIALVNGSAVVQFLSYEGAFTALNGPAIGMLSTNIGVGEAGTEPVGRSLQLQGTGSTYSDFTWTATPIANTSNSVNTGQTFTGVATATIAINDVSIMEGNGGTTNATFTVTVTGAHPDITFDIATADGIGPDAATAADGDYAFQSQSGQISSAGSTFTFTVVVNGDVAFESDEQFVVNLANVSGADVADGQGAGTITNDDEGPPVTSEVVISQVYGGGGNSGATLTHDFIELFNRGASSVSLAGWSVQYSGASSNTWAVTPLSGSIAPGGYYLVRESQGAAGTVSLPAADAIGNIPLASTGGKIALTNRVLAFTGACPPAGTIADLVGYGAANCDEGAGPTPATSNTTAALRKRGGCFDSNNNNADFSIGSPLPRNSSSATRSCGFVSADIHAVQGDQDVTPYLSADVITSGIVTGRKSNGFFIQTADDSDLNPMTSQGLFVFTGAAPAVAVGDAVTARGTATEFFGLTQIESSLPGDVTVVSSGNAVPSAVTLTAAMLDPDGGPNQLERLESMRVHADSLTSVAPTNGFGEISTVLTGVARPLREEGIEVSQPVPPDPSSGVADCCIPRWDENPERILIDTDGLAGAPVVSVTSLVTLTNVSGPLDFAFGAYKVLPEAPPAASADMSAVPVPLPAADEFTIAGFNIENFAGNETQRRKAALAIRLVLHAPDVLGHIEIRDLAALQGLANQINADALAAGEPDPGYEARLIEAPAGGTQNVGFLIKTSRVQIDSVTQELGDELFGSQPTPPARPIYLHDRPPLVLHATVTLPGRAPRPFIVVVNHLRSFIDINLVAGDGPRVRAKRTAQAESTARLLQRLQTDNPATPVISIGDYNAYQFNDGYTDPIAILKGTPTPDDQIVVDESPDLVNPDFTNLTDTLMPLSERYSFVFEGTPQALDHVLVNTVAAPLVQRYAIARNNSDFPEHYANDVTRPERNSDHDMPVAYFAFPPSANISVTASGPAAAVQTGGLFSYTVTVSNDGPDTAANVTVSIPAVSTLRFSALQKPVGAICTEPAPGTSDAISCVMPLVAGATATYQVTVALECAIADTALVSQPIMVSSAASDPDPANNVAMVVVTAANPAPTIFGVTTPVVVSPLAGASQAGAVVTNAALGVVNAADNCGTVTLVRSGVPAGNVFPVGTTTVTYTATDAGGATTTATATVTVLSATESLQAIKADLETILAASTQKALNKRIESVLANVRKAITELDGSHRGPAAAAVFVSAAIVDLEDILRRGLLAAPVAHGLLQRLTGVSWLVAMQQPGNAWLIELGNKAAAGGYYSAASALYWLAIVQAR